MNKSEAEQIVAVYISDMQAEYPFDIAVNYDITEEYEVGFVFFYNAVNYWSTRNHKDSLVGNGPILVRRSGQLAVLPTNQSVAQSISQIEAD